MCSPCHVKLAGCGVVLLLVMMGACSDAVAPTKLEPPPLRRFVEGGWVDCMIFRFGDGSSRASCDFHGSGYGLPPVNIYAPGGPFGIAT